MAKSIQHVAQELFKNPAIAKKYKTLDALVEATRQNRCKADAIAHQKNEDAVVWGTTVSKGLQFHGQEPVSEPPVEAPASKGIAKKS